MSSVYDPQAPDEHSQFKLLGMKKFAPFFWTQFCGAFNDNVFKNSLMLTLAFHAGTGAKGESDILMNLAAGLFILPFFLFSATAGQIADKFNKSRIIQIIKIAEIMIMICAAFAFYYRSHSALLFLLFMMGTHSAFFGPVKYSIIPQHLEGHEIIGGNALVEMGTFVAILIGTILGGLLIQQENGRIYAGVTVIIIAFMGWLASSFIPKAAAADKNLKIGLNPIAESIKTIKFAKREKIVFLSVLGISWFWFLGASYLTQIPNYTKTILGSGEGVVTLLLTMFSVGIGVGSLLCEWLSGRKIEYGLVPIGSIGLSIFGIDLALSYSSTHPDHMLTVMEFLKTSGSIRVLVDLVMIGIFGGLYIVPLYALIQVRTEPEFRSRVIAANNILNALFMVASAAMAGILLGKMGLSIPIFFVILTIMNIVVAIYIYTLVPEFTMRCLVWVLTHIMYRIKHKNLHMIPSEGPAVIVSNHVSYMDALIIASLCRRPARFVMDSSIFKIPVMNFIFTTAKAIPICSRKQNSEVYEKAFESIAEALDAGEIVCIFPEGMITKTGDIQEFKNGIEKILEKNQVPVVPSALRGLWGSFFSHKDGHAMTKFPKRFFSKIEYVVGNPIHPEEASAEGLRLAVIGLRDDAGA